MSLEQKKIMVVKIGSSTLVTGEGKLDTAYLATLASQISGCGSADGVRSL